MSLRNSFQEQPKQIQNCQVCHSGFNLMKRSRVCKRCQRVIDNNCVGGLSTVPSFLKEQQKQRKVCKLCTDEISKIQKIIDQNSLIFGKSSLIGDRWLLNLLGPQQKYLKNLKQEFENNLQISASIHKSDEYKLFLQITNKFQSQQDVINYFSYNYSFCQALSMIMDTEKQLFSSGPCKQIEWVCTAFINKNQKEVGFSEQIFELIVFLLCFMEPFKAWIIVDLLYKKMIPQWCFPIQKGKFIEKQSIEFIQILKENFSIDPNQEKYLLQFLKANLSQNLQKICVGLVGFELLFNLFCNLMERSLVQKINLETALFRAIVSIMGINIQDLLKIQSSEEIKLIIQRNAKIEAISNYLEPLSFSNLNLNSKENEEDQDIYNKNKEMSQSLEKANETIKQLIEQNRLNQTQYKNEIQEISLKIQENQKKMAEMQKQNNQLEIENQNKNQTIQELEQKFIEQNNYNIVLKDKFQEQINSKLKDIVLMETQIDHLKTQNLQMQKKIEELQNLNEQQEIIIKNQKQENFILEKNFMEQITKLNNQFDAIYKEIEEKSVQNENIIKNQLESKISKVQNYNQTLNQIKDQQNQEIEILNQKMNQLQEKINEYEYEIDKLKLQIKLNPSQETM